MKREIGESARVGFEQLDERVTGGEAGDASTVGVFERKFVEAEELSIEGKHSSIARTAIPMCAMRASTRSGWHENRAPYWCERKI